MTDNLQLKTIIATHNGDFHADDIFAVAVLRIHLGADKVEVVRTRDTEVINRADYVVDVGGEYDPEHNRFDHHQKGGGGTRENNIPYAAFGLVWKHFGSDVAGSSDIAEHIDKMFVQTIDAGDNGVEISKPVFPDVYPLPLNSILVAFRPTWNEDQSEESYYARFMMLVGWAELFLGRLVETSRDYIAGVRSVEAAYEAAEDKRIITLDRDYAWQETLSAFPEPLFVIYPKTGNGTWGVKTVRDNPWTFENRKPFPEEWAGKRDEALESVTGVLGAVFCHNNRFLVVAKTREGALALAQKALFM